MEQVAVSALPTQFLVRDGQAYYIQNNQNISLSSCLNSDIVQQALDGLNTGNISDTQWDINKQKSTLDQNYFVLNKDRIEDEGVVQLSISEDFPFHLLNSSKNGDPIQQVDQQTCLVENVLCSEAEKTDNAISIDNLSSFLQLSPSSGSSELYDVSSNLKGNVTYAYQLTNGTRFNQLVQNACLTMPINTTNGFTNVQNPVNKTLEQIQTPSDKSNGNGKKIVLLRGGPKILLKLKNKGVQDAAKNLHKVRIVPANPANLKNQRNIAPQKFALPPLNRPKTKEVIYPNQAIQPQNQEFKSKPPPTSSQVLSNFLKLKAVTNPNSTSATKIINSSSVVTSGLGKTDLVLPSEEEPVPVTDSSLLLEIPKSPNNQSQPGERLSESELKKIATAFQNGELNINKLNNSATLYDTESKTKIICRIVYPEELVEDKGKAVENNGKKKMRGRPSFRASLKKNTPEVLKKVKEPENLARTRSGRLSRPPRYMLEDFKKLMENSDISCSENEEEGADENIENTPTIYKEGLVRRRAIKSKCPTCEKSYPGKKMLLHLAKYPDHGDVNTVLFTLVDSAQKPKPASFKSGWKKFLHSHRSKLDSSSLKELMSSYSDEVFLAAVQERFTKTVSPWNYVIERQPAGEGAVKGLLADLSDILNSVPSNMLQKVEPTDPNAIHISDERLCSLLNITPGSYLPNDSVIKPPVKSDKPGTPTPALEATPMETESLPSKEPQELSDERLCSLLNIAPGNYLANDSSDAEMVKLETGSLKENTPMETEPIPTVDLGERVKEKLKAEESLDLGKKELSDLLEKSPLETVDEILNERLNDLIPLDDVSSLVEGSSLERSLFSTNSLELPGVSGSTEDLLKTLEHFTPELPPVSVTTDFDFTVLSTDFGNER